MLLLDRCGLVDDLTALLLPPIRIDEAGVAMRFVDDVVGVVNVVAVVIVDDDDDDVGVVTPAAAADDARGDDGVNIDDADTDD